MPPVVYRVAISVTRPMTARLPIAARFIFVYHIHCRLPTASLRVGLLRPLPIHSTLYPYDLSCRITNPRSVPLSQHLRPLLVRLSAAHPSTKFLSIPASLCIPNYPDKNVPTLLVYRNGEITGNVVAGLGLRGMKTTVRGESGAGVKRRRADDNGTPRVWSISGRILPNS